MFPLTSSWETSRLSGKQNKLFPSGTDIKCIILYITWLGNNSPVLSIAYDINLFAKRVMIHCKRFHAWSLFIKSIKLHCTLLYYFTLSNARQFYLSRGVSAGDQEITGIIGSPDIFVDFILVSESEIALNTRAWKLSRSPDARVGIVITMIHRIYHDNAHASVWRPWLFPRASV
jgi:hypothetical protein